MGNWETVAAVASSYPDPDNLFGTPYELAADLLIGPVTSWPFPAFIASSLSHSQQLQLRATDVVLVARYSAALAGGEEQKEAERRIRLANLALWLARPTSMGFWLVADVEVDGGERLWRGHRLYQRLLPVAGYRDESLQAADLPIAKRLVAALESVPKTGALWAAIGLQLKALREIDEAQRLLLLWVAIEALFGPEDGREITYRLAQRVGLFEASNPTDAWDLFQRTKTGYGWRSKIVHGMRVAKMTATQSEEQVLFAEEILRRASTKILGDANLVEIFSGEKREAHLDRLAFH